MTITERNTLDSYMQKQAQPMPQTQTMPAAAKSMTANAPQAQQAQQAPAQPVKPEVPPAQLAQEAQQTAANEAERANVAKAKAQEAAVKAQGVMQSAQMQAQQPAGMTRQIMNLPVR